MRRYFIIILACLSIFGCSRPNKDQLISVIPEPSMLLPVEGEFVVRSSTKIFLSGLEEETEHIARMLNDYLKTSAGIELEIVKTGDLPCDDGIWFLLSSQAPEAYAVNVGSKRVVIEFGDGAGAFYAMETLLQLLPPEVLSRKRVHGMKLSMPCCIIEDAPRFRYRGMHIDVCLHYFDLDFLKRYIDLMAFHKLNRFHWHLTDDQGWRLEIKKYPLLTEKGQWRKQTVIGSLKSGVYDGIPHGGYYTQEQVRELVKYAADRYVTIIPEIEMPGHALAAVACYPELSCGLEEYYETATRWGVFKQVYCPKEETFKFLEDVFDEVFELFPSKLVHVGGDECPKASWKKCPHCQSLIKKLGLKDEFELQSWFITRMEKYINSKDHQIIGWDEILQGGLAPNAKVMSWLGEEGGIKAAKQHHEVVMTPYPKYYLDYWQADPDSEPLAMGGPTTLRTMYEYNPVPESLTAEERRFIIGVEGCLWTEYVSTPEHAEYMAWPRMCAIAESAWSNFDRKDWDSFTRRMEKHFLRLDALEVNYCDAFHNPYIVLHDDTEYDKVVEISVDAPDAQIRFTLDGTDPDSNSTLYTVPFVMNRSQEVKAAAFRNGKMIGKISNKRYN